MNIENQNYKILVSTQQEAKEIQKIFFACGYKWAWQRYAEQRDVRLGFFIESFCNDLGLIETTDSDKKEITLPELREFFQKSPWSQIESLKAQLAQYQSDDYVLVPKEPTDKMIKAGENNHSCIEMTDKDEVKGIYKAMIEAQEQHNAKS